MTYTIISGAFWISLLIACAGFSCAALAASMQREYRWPGIISLIVSVALATVGAVKAGQAAYMLYLVWGM